MASVNGPNTKNPMKLGRWDMIRASTMAYSLGNYYFKKMGTPRLPPLSSRNRRMSMDSTGSEKENTMPAPQKVTKPYQEIEKDRDGITVHFLYSKAVERALASYRRPSCVSNRDGLCHSAQPPQRFVVEKLPEIYDDMMQIDALLAERKTRMGSRPATSKTRRQTSRVPRRNSRTGSFYLEAPSRGNMWNPLVRSSPVYSRSSRQSSGRQSSAHQYSYRQCSSRQSLGRQSIDLGRKNKY